MNRLILLILVALSVVLQVAKSDEAKSQKRNFNVVLDESLFNSKSGQSKSDVIGTAWMAYAMARVAYSSDQEQREISNGGELVFDDYVIELQSRQILATFWEEKQQTGEAGADSYLDKLVEINRAGFLEEYVIGTYAKPGWSIPAEELSKFDGKAFGDWAETTLAGFKPQTLSRIDWESAPSEPEIPGGGLPDPEDFDPTRKPCLESMDGLRAAITQWGQEAAQLQGAPLAVDTLQGFVSVLQVIKDTEPYRSQGLTWVSTRAGLLAFLTGYCSVDIGNMESAKDWLQQAMVMFPTLGSVRLEYAHILIMERKFDDAETHIDHVMETSKDRCDLGRAWRNRGYIRFEQGRLDEARTAYEQSLEHDPESRIAYSELKMLEIEITRNGGKPSEYQPPPSQGSMRTTCSAVLPQVALGN